VSRRANHEQIGILQIGSVTSTANCHFLSNTTPLLLGSWIKLEAQPEVGPELAFRSGAESHNQAPSSSAGIEAIWATVHSPGAVP